VEIDRILTIWEQLAERERKVMLTYAYRLLAGQKKYGALIKFKKQWGYEAIQEAVDASVYLTAALQDWVDHALDTEIVNAEKEVQNIGQEDGPNG